MKNATLLIEAESFADHGGWTLDTQFIHSMGSPYLNAHGLGTPVAPAATKVTLPESGQWFVWVRTRNWVPGPWDAPGRFKLAINGEALSTVFGTEPDDWGWQSGGPVELEGTDVTLSLIDLTGFNGRCDAILLTQNGELVPDNSSEPMCGWRREYGAVEDLPERCYDLVVAGGGIAGCSAAISAARMGLSVALIHDRAVLGGNASSEVLVGPSGNFVGGRFPDLGDIVKEISPDSAPGEHGTEFFVRAETQRRKVVGAEPNLDLLLGHYVYDVEAEDSRIAAVWVMNAHGKQRRRLVSRFFVDATGHGTVGLKAGADHRMEAGERMGMTNIWKWRWADHDVAFPETPWALQLTEKGFPYPGNGGWLNENGEPARPRFDRYVRPAPAKNGFGGQWFWENGFDKHPLDDLEAIRDHNLRAAFGAFNAMKNHGVYADVDASGRSHATADLYWMACIGGPRETLQILGDTVVTKEDVWEEREFPDGCVPATWGIDVHLPLPLYERETPDNPFISRAHFDGRVDDSHGKWAESPRPCVMGEHRDKHDPSKGYLFPYRSFYSRNIENLFMAGRDLSCTHEALGTVRVQNTLGMVGVVVGRAASLACKYETTPRGVYEKHWDELSDLLSEPGDHRGRSRAVPDL